jgi:hypothetical protein
MSTVQKHQKIHYVRSGTATLLAELGEECQHIVTLLTQLEKAGLPEEKIEDMLGELSAAILHLHEHTRYLDNLLDEDSGSS